MPRSSAADAAETARRILATAVVHFAERGYAEAAVEDIARDASVTRGAVYHHYSSKQGLFRAVVEDQQSRVAAHIAEAADGRPVDEALRAGSHAFLDAITAEAAARVLVIDAPSVIGWVEWRQIDARAGQAHLREVLSDLGVDPLDGMTQLLSGAMNEAALWVAEDPTRADDAHRSIDRMIDAVIATTPGHRGNRSATRAVRANGR